MSALRHSRYITTLRDASTDCCVYLIHKAHVELPVLIFTFVFSSSDSWPLEL